MSDDSKEIAALKDRLTVGRFQLAAENWDGDPVNAYQICRNFDSDFLLARLTAAASALGEEANRNAFAMVSAAEKVKFRLMNDEELGKLFYSMGEKDRDFFKLWHSDLRDRIEAQELKNTLTRIGKLAGNTFVVLFYAVLLYGCVSSFLH